MASGISALLDDSSDSENDADYVPSGAESEEISEPEDQDGGETTHTQQRRKPAKQISGSRKRSGGIKLEDDEQGGGSDQDDESEENGEDKDRPASDDKKELSDTLWKDFLKDVDPPAKSKRHSTNLSGPGNSQKPSLVADSKQADEKQETGMASEKMTITEVYHFAGEEVTVKKDVKKDSLEAQQFLQKQEDEGQKQETKRTTPSTPVGTKRPAGLNSIIGKLIDKKSKLNVLEKSKLDWDQFKQEEDITEDLETHNRGKGGYLEKQAFLQRTDLRQFEIEKQLRSKMRKTV